MATTPLSVLPLPRTPDPYEAPALRWGVLGPGWIAQRFVETLQANTGQHVLAVASRDQSRASAFAAQWSLAKAYDSYEALFDDPDIDIVYIATTHPSHRNAASAASTSTQRPRPPARTCPHLFSPLATRARP